MFKKQTLRISIALICLMMIGLLMIYSSSRIWAMAKFNDEYYFLKRQAVFAILGIILFMICSKISLMKLRSYKKLLLIACFVALVVVLIPGIGIARNGSRSWFGIGSFLVQPSEFYKIAIIVYGADFLAKRGRIMRFKKDLLPLGIVMMLGFGLIMLQPDFGSGMVMCCSVVVMVLAADAPISYFKRMFVLALLALGGLIISAPYRVARIVSFVDPWQDPLGSGFQIIQSLFAITPGGLLGVGFDSSMQKHFYLPEPQTDFIFAIFCEEFGFIGAFFLLLLYLFIIYQGIVIALKAKNSYLCYVAMGIIALFAIQVMINLGVVVGLFPVTGITLPFMSYGGSSLMVMMSSMGLLVSIANES